jgi:pimeloyl-ACP methyl ester carboxylesterase
MRPGGSSLARATAPAPKESCRPCWNSSALCDARNPAAYGIANTSEVNVDPDWKIRWASVTVIFYGAQTFRGMPEAADAVAAALPNATRRIVAGEGHGPSTEGILPPLLEFLRAV